jgi:hypothetical protein
MTREIQKTALISILQSVAYDGSTISVSDRYISDSDTYPYFSVFSGEFRTEFQSNRRYKEVRNYYIELSFSLDQAIKQTVVDTVEELIILKLREESTKDQNPNAWLDLRLTDVSSPYRQSISETDEIVIKTFTVEAETYPNYN